MIKPSNIFKLSLLSSAIVLTGCGGSSGSDDDPVVVENIAPIVSLSDQTVNEHSDVSITAIASDSDGSIASYSWQQTGGIAVELTNSNTDTISFVAPEVKSDEVIALSVTVTDNDGSTATAQSNVNVSQLTIPLTIAGLATDSPIMNGEISVHVAGREITVDVTADENGIYSVDLLLDDSEANAFISIVAHGVAEQANAGLITLLGTAGQLSTAAGEDATLTEDENFSVNVTNITTAQYALAKLANNGEDITSDSELEALTQTLNYEEVLTLATAIKVAIDKSAENPELALPEGTANTLELIENIEATQAYVQEVINEPEFQEAQEEILADESLVDNSSSWNIPEAYYILPKSALHRGAVFRFNEDNTGSNRGINFTWSETNGVITTINDDPGSVSFEFVEINGETVQVEVHHSTPSYELKRLNSSNSGDILLITHNQLKHYPGGEMTDEITSYSSTDSAVTSTIDITHSGAGVAYLPFYDEYPDNPNHYGLSADEFVLNEDGTGHATYLDFDFSWSVENDTLMLNLAPEEGNVYVPTWKKLSNNLFTHEFYENDELNPSDDFLAFGGIVSAPMNWQSEDIVGFYTYDQGVFNNPHENFWIELHENGDADTISSGDYNDDGEVTADELYIRYGKWTLNADGTISVTRVISEDGQYIEECRDGSTPGCMLQRTRTWRIINDDNGALTILHKFDFPEGGIIVDTRMIYKTETAPISVSESSALSTNQTPKKPKVSSKYSLLEPEVR